MAREENHQEKAAVAILAIDGIIASCGNMKKRKIAASELDKEGESRLKGDDYGDNRSNKRRKYFLHLTNTSFESYFLSDGECL